MDAKDCKNKNDVVVHLMSNLNYIADNNVFVGDYQQLFGFRRLFMISQVWYHHKNHTWAFHVSDDEFTGEPNMGVYDTLPQLLDGVADIYVKNWKL